MWAPPSLRQRPTNILAIRTMEYDVRMSSGDVWTYEVRTLDEGCSFRRCVADPNGTTLLELLNVSNHVLYILDEWHIHTKDKYFYPSGKSILRGKYGQTSLKYMTLVRYRVVLSLCLYVFVWLDTSILLNKYFKRGWNILYFTLYENVFYVLHHNKH